MRNARKVMSSRLPMGVATRYREPWRAFSGDSECALPVMESVKPVMELLNTESSMARGRLAGACYNRFFVACAGGETVPLYEYQCTKCHKKTEKIESVA